MIISKELKIQINRRNITYYSNFYNNLKINSNIIVNVENLHKGSTSKILVKCDICNNEKNMEYRLYNNNIKNSIDNKYYCNKCKSLKTKQTKLEKYGNENYNNSNKNKETCLLKYGVEHYNKLEYFKNKIKNTKKIKYNDENYNNIEKSKQTKLEKYGNENYNNSNKNKETCLLKYGVDNVFKKAEIKNKSYDSRKKRLINLYKNYNLIDIDYKEYNYKCKCKKEHIFEIPKNIFYNRITTNTTLCTICNPINSLSSDKESQLLYFIKENYKNKIIENNRDIIKPYELDIYLPELNLAFEFNGLYWHNEEQKDNYYHYNKTNLCLEKNIQLIHIYEDEWIYKQNIVKSRILNLLKLNKERIYARKCIIKEIKDTKIVKKFLENNHIQGNINSLIKIGLYYNEELVSLITFGKNRKIMGNKAINNEYELLRFCNKLQTIVIGGASKLFNYFIKNYKPKQIVSYADRSWSIGNMYEKLGFKLIKITEPNYYYIVNNMRKHRFEFRKDILVKQGYDKNKTEHQIMLERKIYRIYNSGNLKYNFNIND